MRNLSAYRSQAEDTHPDSDRYQFQLLRMRSAAQRVQMAAKLMRGAKALSLRGIKQVRGAQYRQYFAQAVLAEKWLPQLTPTSDEQMWIQDSTELAKQLHGILEPLNIAYYITGGVASIVYGEPRTTRDLDLVVEINQADIARLVTVLERSGFYCPLGAIEEIQRGQGHILSVTHTETILNADIILHRDSAFVASKMQRRRLEIMDAAEARCWVVSPEDLILAKLLWGQRSQSEKQWRDVLGVLKVQGETLNFDYLMQWAEQLNLVDALTQALVEAGL
jgi:hypothetical protein